MLLGPAILLIILVNVIATFALITLTKRKFYIPLMTVICICGIIACGMGHREAQVKAAKQYPSIQQANSPSLGEQVEEQQQNTPTTDNPLSGATEQVTDSTEPSDQTANPGNTTSAAPSSEGRAAADACMEQAYGNWDYAFQNANESSTAQQYYSYKVTKHSDILTESFNVLICYETSYRRAYIKDGSITEMYDPRSPLWDDKTERLWNLTGTWIYQDSQRNFSVTISNVSGDTITMQYNLTGYNIDTYSADSGQALSSNGSVQATITPYLGVDDNQWFITDGDNLAGDGFSLWLYPFGSTETTGGDGSGSVLTLDGCHLTRR